MMLPGSAHDVRPAVAAADEGQVRAVRVLVRVHARDAADEAWLLEALGLGLLRPCGCQLDPVVFGHEKCGCAAAGKVLS